MIERGLSFFPAINKRSVRLKRTWKNKTPEEKAEFSAMRSRVQKETIKNNPHLRKIRAKSMREVVTNYWKTIDPDKKTEHIKKMSDGMKCAWDNANDDFGPKIANKENVAKINGRTTFVDDLPRINDYSGVITHSEMAQL